MPPRRQGGWTWLSSHIATFRYEVVYRLDDERLVIPRLEQPGLTLVGAALTPEEVNSYLDSLEANQRGAARNRIRVWCEWLERRGAPPARRDNPLHLHRHK